MFCSNCGSNIPDGSNFCSVCGAKQEHSAPSTQINEFINDEKETKFENNNTQSFSFDWSTVKEESHKKIIPEVSSPWGDTSSFVNRDIFDSDDFKSSSDNEQTEDHSRTMSFIDLLKQERDEKAKAADEDALPFTQREEEASDFSVFEEVDETKSYYVPPLYKIDDTPEEEETAPLNESVFEPIIEQESEPEPELELEPVVEPELDSELEPVVEPEPVPVVEPEQDNDDNDEDLIDLDELVSDSPVSEVFEPTLVDQDFAESRANDDFDFDEPVTDFDDATFHGDNISFDTVDLDTELGEILSAGSGKHDTAEFVNLFKEDEVQPTIEESEPEIDELSDELSFDESSIEEINFDEPVATDEPQLNNKEIGDKTLADLYMNYEVDAPVAPEPVPESRLEFADEEKESSLDLDIEQEHEPSLTDTMQFSAEEEFPDEESEMEDLKRRLSNLMGSNVEEEKVESEEEETILEIQLGNDDEEEEVEEEEVEIEIEEPAVEPIVEPEPVVEAKTDAISVEDIEKDLFGDVKIEETEPEPTKKIDKFYTLYKKNEEFQKLLDEEYNKLKTEDAVPHVDELLAEKKEEPVATPVAVSTPAPAPVVEEKPAEPDFSAVEKAAEKAAKKAARKAIKAESDGSKLTVAAVIVAVLLAIVLAIILIMYIAPFSALSIKIESFLETIISLFSATDIVPTTLLM